MSYSETLSAAVGGEIGPVVPRPRPPSQIIAEMSLGEAGIAGALPEEPQTTSESE